MRLPGPGVGTKATGSEAAGLGIRRGCRVSGGRNRQTVSSAGLNVRGKALRIVALLAGRLKRLIRLLRQRLAGDCLLTGHQWKRGNRLRAAGDLVHLARVGGLLVLLTGELRIRVLLAGKLLILICRRLITIGLSRLWIVRAGRIGILRLARLRGRKAAAGHEIPRELLALASG